MTPPFILPVRHAVETRAETSPSSQGSVDVPVTEWRAGACRTLQDHVTREEPLEIRINGTAVSVTMRTPGHDRELAAGFLYTEGIIRDAGELAAANHATNSPGCNVVEASLTSGVPFEPAMLQRHFFASSSCGICGKATIAAVRRRHLPQAGGNLPVSPEMLCRLPASLRDAQEVFSRTGGLHAAALFDRAGSLLVLREDVGRHNAVDKVVGWALLRGGLPLAGAVLLVSGRGGFEIVQKAVAAGIPVLACISAPSSLAVDLARETGQTLVGFLRGERFLVYSGHHRIRYEG